MSIYDDDGIPGVIKIRRGGERHASYDVIYADPPWKYRDKRLGRGGAEFHYSTMSIKEIREVGCITKRLAAEDAFLFMWGTWPLLPDMGSVMDDWGFTYKTCAFVWCKTRKLAEVDQSIMFADESLDMNDDSFVGCGNYTRSNSEYCLLATKGKVQVVNRDVKQVIYAPIMRHSEKPAETRDRIVRLCGDVPRIELFSRQVVPGWDAWGNQI